MGFGLALVTGAMLSAGAACLAQVGPLRAAAPAGAEFSGNLQSAGKGCFEKVTGTSSGQPGVPGVDLRLPNDTLKRVGNVTE